MRWDFSVSGSDLSVPLMRVVSDGAFKLVIHQKRITVGRDSKNYRNDELIKEQILFTALRSPRYSEMQKKKKKGLYVFLRKGFLCLTFPFMSLSLYLILYHINSDHLTEITVNPYEFVVAIFPYFDTTI